MMCLSLWSALGLVRFEFAGYPNWLAGSLSGCGRVFAKLPALMTKGMALGSANSQ
jgi:hypothetical protein